MEVRRRRHRDGTEPPRAWTSRRPLDLDARQRERFEAARRVVMGKHRDMENYRIRGMNPPEGGGDPHPAGLHHDPRELLDELRSRCTMIEGGPHGRPSPVKTSSTNGLVPRPHHHGPRQKRRIACSWTPRAGHRARADDLHVPGGARVIMTLRRTWCPNHGTAKIRERRVAEAGRLPRARTAVGLAPYVPGKFRPVELRR